MEPTAHPTPARRPVLLGRWLAGAWPADFSPAEQGAVRSALGRCLETDVEALLARAALGEVGLYTLPLADGVAVVTFFEVEKLADGRLHFISHATVALGQGVRRVAETDLEVMERLASKLGCAVCSMVTSRPGLLKQAVEKHGWRVEAVRITREVPRVS